MDIRTSASHTGAKNELVACIWLMNQGYSVFRNVSPVGEVDIIAMRSGEVIKIDVKTSNPECSNGITATEFLRKKQLGIRILCVQEQSCFWMDEHRSAIKPPCRNCGNPVPLGKNKFYCSRPCRMAVKRFNSMTAQGKENP